MPPSPSSQRLPAAAPQPIDGQETQRKSGLFPSTTEGTPLAPTETTSIGECQPTPLHLPALDELPVEDGEAEDQEAYDSLSGDYAVSYSDVKPERIQQRMEASVTVDFVGQPRPGMDDRKYDETFADVARAFLEDFVATHGGQVEAARLLGLSQATVSRCSKGITQPSVKVLIALREHTGKTIDQLLGLPLLPNHEFTPEMMEKLRVLLATPTATRSHKTKK